MVFKDGDPANNRNPNKEPQPHPFEITIENPEDILDTLQLLKEKGLTRLDRFIDNSHSPVSVSEGNLLLHFSDSTSLSDKAGKLYRAHTSFDLGIDQHQKIEVTITLRQQRVLPEAEAVKIGYDLALSLLRKISRKGKVTIQSRYFKHKGKKKISDESEIEDGFYDAGRLINIQERTRQDEYETFICMAIFENLERFAKYLPGFNLAEFKRIKTTALNCITEPNAWKNSPEVQVLWDKLSQQLQSAPASYNRFIGSFQADEQFFFVTVAREGIQPLHLQFKSTFFLDFCQKYGIDCSQQKFRGRAGTDFISLGTEQIVEASKERGDVYPPGMFREKHVLSSLTQEQLDIYRKLAEDSFTILCQAKGVSLSGPMVVRIDDAELDDIENKLSALPSYKVGKNPPMNASEEEVVPESATVADEVAEAPTVLPKTGFDKVGGQTKAVEKAKMLVSIINNAAEFTKRGVRLPKGMLFVGPPGVGKTLLARTIAEESNAEFIEVKITDVLSKWFGESSANVAKVFERARTLAASGKIVVLYMDEIEALGKDRELGDDSLNRVVATLLTEIDGLNQVNGIILLAATNHPELVDKALMRSGRIDEVIELTLPSAADLKEIFEIYMANIQASATSKEVIFDPGIQWNIAAAMAFESQFVGADVENLLQIVIRTKVHNEVLHKMPFTPVTIGDLIKGIFNFKKYDKKDEDKSKQTRAQD